MAIKSRSAITHLKVGRDEGKVLKREAIARAGLAAVGQGFRRVDVNAHLILDRATEKVQGVIPNDVGVQVRILLPAKSNKASPGCPSHQIESAMQTKTSQTTTTYQSVLMMPLHHR